MKYPLEAILIDTENNIIKPVTINSFDDIYKLVKCDLITTAFRFKNGDSIFVDDEGLCKEVKCAFRLKGVHSQDFFAGNGIVMGGSNRTGESQNVKSGLLDIANFVTFLTPKLKEVTDFQTFLADRDGNGHLES